MSDLYLVLRNRLATVPEWVYIDSSVLEQARKRKGYSYETTARELHVASKTYERYEKAGRVPRSLLRKVAELFDLEIEEPSRPRVAAITEGSQLDRIESSLARIETALTALAPAAVVLDPARAEDEAAAAQAAAERLRDEGQAPRAASSR